MYLIWFVAVASVENSHQSHQRNPTSAVSSQTNRKFEFTLTLPFSVPLLYYRFEFFFCFFSINFVVVYTEFHVSVEE